MSQVPPRVNRIRSMDDAAVSRAYAKQMRRFQKGYDAAAGRAHEMCPTAGRILDAATGPALGLPELTRLYPDAKITAVDVSAHMLERAHETLDEAGIAERVELVCASVYDLPFEDDTFDLILASQLIHMLDELPRFLGEARRVLADGGTLLISDFRRDVPRWYRGLAWASTRVLRAVRVPMDGMGPVIAASYTPDELTRALREAGFSELSVQPKLAEMGARGIAG